MRDFITGLQFLTTIRLWPETEWSPERFGRSVRFFPVIGAILGILQAGIYYTVSAWLPEHIIAALLIFSGIILTGGLHCDGFMDTMDGIFSGRSREKMLDIMKDSRVGANGVVAFVCLVLLKWSIFLDLTPSGYLTALFTAPVAGRIAMVIAITRFPYARPEGIGKAFSQFAGGRALYISVVTGCVLMGIGGGTAFMSGLVGITAGLLFARMACAKLGGLTGDLYGAVTEITELATLGSVLIILK